MARYEGKITAAGEAVPSLAELIAAMEAQNGKATDDRQAAIACYLSGTEGWREAVTALDGAFAAHRAGLEAQKDR